MKSISARAADAKAYYNGCKVNPDNSHQKFPIGAHVKVSENLGSSMSHFRKGFEATVKYTYSQKFGGNHNYESYCLIPIDQPENSLSWYYERQLTLIER